MSDYTLSAKITGDSRGFEKAFSTAQKAAGNFENRMKRISSKLGNWGKSLSGIGTKLTLGITTPLTLAGKSMVSAASDFDENLNKVNVAFGKSANEVTAWAENATKQFGLSKNQALEATSLFGDMATSMGLTQPAAADMSTALAGLAGDLASFKNISIEQAMTALAGVFTGETESLKQLGIVMTETNLEEFASKTGKVYKEMSQAEKVQLRYNYVMEMAANAQGDYANTADGTANSLRTFQGAVDNLNIALGQHLLPVITPLVQRATEMVNAFAKASPQFQQAALKIAFIAAVAGPALIILGTLVSSIGKLAGAIGFLASPIGIVITAITALIAGFALLMNTNETFRNIVLQVWNAVQSKIQEVAQVVQPIAATLFQNFLNEIKSFMPVLDSMFSVVKTVAGTLLDAFSGIANGFSAGMSGVQGFGNVFSMVLGLIAPQLKMFLLLFKNFGPQIVNLVSVIGSNLVPVFETLGNTIGGIVSAFLPALQSLLANLAPVITNIVNVGSQLIGAVLDVVVSALPIIINLIQQIAPFLVQIATMIGNVISAIGPMISQLAGTLVPLLSNIITIVQTVSHVIMDIASAVMPAVIGVMNVIMSIIQAIVPSLTNVISVVTSIVSIVIGVVSSIMSAISPIVAFIGTIITTIMSVISPIITFIADVIATVISIIGGIYSAINGVLDVIISTFSTGFTFVQSVFANISKVISRVIGSVSKVVSTLSGVFGNIFNSIYSIVSSIMGRVGNFITGIFNGIKTSWNGLTSFVSGVFSGVSGAVEELVSQVKGFVNGVIGGINSAIGLINKIPGVDIGKIPQLLHGTDDWQGGFARMNEGGRGELTYLPNGTQVIPHDISVKYAKEAARNSANVEPVDMSALGQYIVNAVSEQGAQIANGLQNGMSKMKFTARDKEVIRYIESLGFSRG